MSKIKFHSKEYEEFFYTMLLKGGNMDVYHQAFFYTVGIAVETRISSWRLDCPEKQRYHMTRK